MTAEVLRRDTGLGTETIKDILGVYSVDNVPDTPDIKKSLLEIVELAQREEGAIVGMPGLTPQARRMSEGLAAKLRQLCGKLKAAGCSDVAFSGTANEKVSFQYQGKAGYIEFDLAEDERTRYGDRFSDNPDSRDSISS